uniref:Uncharacterized protein n=1 Tax=Micrurus lemniscatus lemniscatus TaxID=129467 RepID=A0A2D4H8I1_MICLE
METWWICTDGSQFPLLDQGKTLDQYLSILASLRRVDFNSQNCPASHSWGILGVEVHLEIYHVRPTTCSHQSRQPFVGDIVTPYSSFKRTMLSKIEIKFNPLC